MNVLTRGEAFGKLIQARVLLRKAEQEGRRREQKIAAVRTLVLEVFESEAWQQIEDPATCKRDRKGNPEPGTGKPYRGFGRCAADALAVTKRHANRLEPAAQVERNLAAEVGPAVPLLGTEKLLVLADLEPDDFLDVAVRLRSAPDVGDMETAEFLEWIDRDEDDDEEEEIDYDSLSPEEKCDLVDRAARRHRRKTRQVKRLSFGEYWTLAWKRLGKWSAALRGTAVPADKKAEAEALAARLEEDRRAVAALAGVAEE